MAGLGAFPLRSSWLTRTHTRSRVGAVLLYENIGFGDANADERNIVRAWLFGAGTAFTLSVSATAYAVTWQYVTFSWSASSSGAGPHFGMFGLGGLGTLGAG